MPSPHTESVEGLSLVTKARAKPASWQKIRPSRESLAKLRTFRQRLPIIASAASGDRVKSAGLLELLGRRGPAEWHELVADTSQGPWSKVTSNVVSLVADEERFHRHPQYVVDFLGAALGIGSFYQYQRQHPGLNTLIRWFFEARSQRPAIVVAARAKPLASAAVAEKRGKLIERPVDPTFLPRSLEKRPLELMHSKTPLEIGQLRFTRPGETVGDRRATRAVLFERLREIAGQQFAFSRETYYAFGSPEAHAEDLGRGYIPGLNRFYKPRQQVVDAPNFIFAVLPGPGMTDDVRDLYVSFDKDDGETILIAQGLRPPSLFLDTNPVIEKFDLDVGLLSD